MDEGFGGGLYCSWSSPTLTNVTFSHNQAFDAGGMYSDSYSSPELTDVTFSHNQAHSGGGLYCDGSSSTLTNVTFSHNEGWWGGGMYCVGPGTTLTGCGFYGNSASSGGGGMWCRMANPITLTDCTFYGNSAYQGGGLVCEYYTDATLVSCTLAGNSAMDGGGMWLGPDRPFSHAWATLTNCIIAFSIGGQAMSFVESGAALTCCDLYGNGGGDWVGYIANQYGINGNMCEDPLFCGGQDPEERLTLHSNSPCAAENSPECGQIGAWGVGCPSTPVEEVSWGSIKAMFR
jgi:predicted outer membrane repeat protein